jgi:hypothetical protein
MIRLYSGHLPLCSRYVESEYSESVDESLFTHHLTTVTWWWIAYHSIAIVIVLQHRNDEEMKWRFRILMLGLIVEGSALCTFLALPVLRLVFKNMPWHKKYWNGHRVASIAMLVFWAVVLIIGFDDKLPNFLFPCTDSQSFVCSILISYAGERSNGTQVFL